MTHFKHNAGNSSALYSVGQTDLRQHREALNPFKHLRMKTKTALIILLSVILGYTPLAAQNNASNEDIKTKVSLAVDALDESFKLEKAKKNAIEEIFSDFYNDQQKLKNNIQRPASGLAQGLSSQDFQSVRKRNEALIAERDNRLKKELTEDQYKKWKGDIEPSLHKRKK
jgi:hypothetical protein